MADGAAGRPRCRNETLMDADGAKIVTQGIARWPSHIVRSATRIAPVKSGIQCLNKSVRGASSRLGLIPFLDLDRRIPVSLRIPV